MPRRRTPSGRPSFAYAYTVAAANPRVEALIYDGVADGAGLYAVSDGEPVRRPIGDTFAVIDTDGAESVLSVARPIVGTAFQRAESGQAGLVSRPARSRALPPLCPRRRCPPGAVPCSSALTRGGIIRSAVLPPPKGLCTGSRGGLRTSRPARGTGSADCRNACRHYRPPARLGADRRAGASAGYAGGGARRRACRQSDCDGSALRA